MPERGWSPVERANRLRTDFGRTVRLGVAVSIALHAAAVVALRPVRIFPDPQQPASIGYAGPMRVIDLAPRDEVLRSQIDLAQRRLQGGAMITGELDVEDPEPMKPVRADALEPARPRSAEPEPEPPGPEATIVIELSEDWQRQTPEALSELFQVTRIVRPEYPREAVLLEQQGLVSLEVRVGISGKVLNVRILESPYGGRALERAAIQSMLDWEFRPFLVNDRPVPFTVVVPFRFRLVD